MNLFSGRALVSEKNIKLKLARIQKDLSPGAAGGGGGRDETDDRTD